MVLKKLLQYLYSRAVHHGKSVAYHTVNLHHHVRKIARQSSGLMHQHRHHFFTFAHISLLLALFMFYHLDSAIFASDQGIVAPTEAATDVSIEATPVESSTVASPEVTVPAESSQGEISAVVDEMGNVIQLGTWIEDLGTWIEDLGTSTGEIDTGTWIEDLGTSTGEISTGIITPLSAVYPEQRIHVNASGYVVFNSLKTVTTTGGEAGATYCSRIAYENLFRILKAGSWTTDVLLPRGDAELLISQGISGSTLVEVPATGLLNIFTGSLFASGVSIYDVYARFVVAGETVSHRITVVYADDNSWYVLDPLRGTKTLAPQYISDYLAYYNDEQDVHRYMGQVYSPLLPDVVTVVTGQILAYLQTVENEQLAIVQADEVTTNTGEIISTETVLGTGTLDSVLTGQAMMTADVGVLTHSGQLVELITGNVLAGGTGKISISDEPIVSGLIMTGVDEEIITGYFDKAYGKGTYSEKITELQKLLAWMQLYDGDIDGVYEDQLISSIYQYQLQNDLLKGKKNNKSVRGYLGPNTRKALNESYIEYQLYKISELAELGLSQCEKKDIQCRKQELQDTLMDKGYSLTKKGLVQMSKEALIGSEDVDMSEIRGELMIQIVLQSVNTLSGKIAEVSLPEGTIIKDGENKIFADEIMAPEFISSEKITEEDIFSGKELVALIDVGADEHVHFEDAQGEPLYATLRMPVPGQTVGDTIEVKYSENGEDRFVLTEVLVQNINGEPYVVFESSHFTYFAIGAPIGTFMINDNASSTIATGVTLALDVPGATHMRFANTEAGIASATWVVYASGYLWTLANSAGLQTVYAQCSGSYGIQSIQDSILLDTTTLHPNLRVWIDSTLSGFDLLNQTSFGANYNFATFGSLPTPIISGDQVMSFNGTTQYAQTGNIDITAYPFTISAWVNTDTLAGTDAIVSIGNSATTTTYYGIQLTAGKASIVARNTTSYVGTSPEILIPGQRYHIVGVFNSATQRFIYVNGVRHATNTSSATFATTNQQVRIGRYVGSSTNYFDGYIDDVRIYSTGLSNQEILAIYQSRAGGFERPIQYLNAGEFTINSGDSTTYTGAITLVSNVSGATHMRFGNTPGELSGASWMVYNNSYAWNIDTTTSGNKIVYAQFSGIDTIREAQDNIYFEKITDTSLKLLLDGRMNGTDVLDRTTNNYHLSGFGSLGMYNILGEQVLGFNGSSQYAQRGGIGITNYPFTFSAWINTNTLAGTDAIIAMGNSAATNSYYAIQLVKGAPSIVARNTTTRTNTVQQIITGQRYHIVGVFNSSTNRILYLNGVPMVTATTTATFASTNQQVRIGRYVGSTTNYFDGYIDDARIYSRALTSGEIVGMYQQHGTTTIVPVSNIIYNTTNLTSGNVIATLTGFSESIAILNNNGSGIYAFTGNGEFTFLYQDSDGNQGSTIAYVDWIDKDAPTFAGVTSGSVYTGILSGSLYIGNIAITFSDANLSGATLNGSSYTSGMVITGAGNYIFEVSDLAGNTTGASFIIQLQTEQQINNQLISSGYTVGSTSLVPLDENYYIGTADINMAPFTGQLLVGTVLQSSNSFGGNLSEVEIPIGAVLENAGAIPFIGVLQVPEFQTPSNYETALGKSIISAIDVGSANHIYFKDTGGNDMEVIFRMPVPGRSEGELIDIYTSEDGSSFDYHISTNVRLIGGQPYVLFTSTHFSVVVTSANNGTNVSADKAANSTSGSTYTALSNIVIAEGVNTDLGVSQTNRTLILTAPTNRKFRAGSGTVAYTANRDITAASISVTNSTATITYSTNGTPNRVDRLTISNLWIQAISGNVIPASGNILRTCANSGTAPIVGITCDVTNFGSLSQTFGAAKNMIITLPGQSFIAGSGTSGAALNQRKDIQFTIPSITATDQFFNVVTSYTGSKTLSYTGVAGIFTTGVTFATGVSTSTLYATFTEAKIGANLAVSDGVLSGPWSSTFDVLDRSAIVSYSTTGWSENQTLNNGSISGYIIATLSTGAFSGNVANYVTLTNVPAGLTGVFALSGTNKLIVTLSGAATSHGSGDSTGNLIITFLTGAFSGYLPSDVLSSTQTGITVTFYDPVAPIGIAPSDDTMIDADTYSGGVGNCADGKCQRNNYGATDYICASDFGSKNLFRFSMASLPTGATITSASLNLYRFQIDGATDATGFTIKQIINNAGWIEGTRDTQQALTGEPNYIQRKWNQENWNNGSPGMQQGLDYASTNLISVGGFTGSNAGSYNQSFSFNSDGVSLVQSWFDDPGANQGIVMGDIPATWLCIRSKEYATVNQRPSLSVNYYVDSNKPILVSFTPTVGATGVSLISNLFMNFDENVRAVSGKNITIRKLSDNSIIQTINVANTGLVTIINNQVLINPSSDFVSNTGYYINVDSGAFRDRAYNTFDGVTGTSVWWFTTINTTNLPVVTGSSFTGIFATTGILGGTITTTGGTITQRGVCWSTTNGFNDCDGTIVSETGNWTDTGAFTYPVTGLLPGTLIYFKAFATNSAGSAYSLQNSFWTRPDKANIDIATKIDNHEFIANWYAITGALSYKFYLSTDTGFASYVTGYDPVSGLTGLSLSVNSGINRTTQYYYKVAATNSAGDGIISEYTGALTTFYPRPIAWLQFEQLAGNVAYDSAEGAYHDGIILNATLNQTGVGGRAFCYNGGDVSIVNFNYGSHYTIGFWFATTSTGDNMHIFSHGGDNDTSSINVILDHATQTLKTYVNGNQSLFVLGSGVYNRLIDGNRHYYTVSVDNGLAVPGKYRVVVYVDGLRELIDASMNAAAYTPSNNLVLGRVSNATSGYYKGCIDDFRVFDQVLDTGEVMDLYTQLGSSILPTASVMYSPGAGTGTTGAVTATLGNYSKPVTITNNSGSDTHVFTGNGSFTYQFIDRGGITGSTTARVNRINPVLSPITGAATNTLYTSNIITIAGYNTGVTNISITSGTLYKNGVALSGTTATGMDGDTFYIGLVSSTGYLSSLSSTLQIGVTTGVFVVTTRAQGVSISAATGFDFGTWDSSGVQQIIQTQFTGATNYFQAIDVAGNNAGYYTTLSVSDFVNADGDKLLNTNMSVKTLTGIVLLSGTTNPRVVSAITGAYQVVGTGALTFIKRDAGLNTGVVGTYGTWLGFQIIVPPVQNYGDYTGVITYTLYEN